MKQLIRTVKIIGTGSYVPETVFTNEFLEQSIDTNAEWIYNNLGIQERRVAAEGQLTSDLAAKAGLRAIDHAGLTIEDIDLIIVATATPDRKAPSTAALVQNKINAHKAVAFDVAAVCSGFLFATSVASQYVATGVYDNVLVIGADTFSTITDWERRDAVFFGDGAGAAVFSHADEKEGFLAFRLYTDGTGKDNFTVYPGDKYFTMNGKAVYDTATEVLPKAITQVLYDAKMTIEDIDYMLPHQPSIKILQKTAESIGLPFEKVMTNMDKYANTSGGTIPILLDETNRAGRLKKGDNILFAAVGSGWTFGAAIMRWA
ncbi:MAG: ketoacyl-ACP synthase III [Candidatus Brocadiales bacterium]|nr:ketoacyl-ACP synthase III [Candidatus Brocadiales bacterium]